jgi:protein-S-isoprenylcysteine O-methyltransferase Ste14
MSAHDAPDAAREGGSTEWLLRAFAVLAYGFAVSNLARAWWIDQSRWTILMLLLTEAYTLGLLLFARRATLRDASPAVVAATVYAAFFYVLFEAENTRHLIPELVGVALQVAGTAWQFSSKAVLGRSFGLLPARRGLVVSGPYRVVRHPIYLGYLIGHVGFLAANFSLRNAAVLALLYAAQVLRIRREEGVLSADPAYLEYRQRVRWRLVPFVF